MKCDEHNLSSLIELYNISGKCTNTQFEKETIENIVKNVINYYIDNEKTMDFDEIY